MRIAPFDGDAAEWDAFVAATPGGTFCHLHAWRAVLADGLGHDLGLLAARTGRELEGVLSLAAVRGPLGSFLVSVPFLNYGGAIGTRAARTELISHAVEEGRARGVDLVELRRRTPAADALAGGHDVPGLIPEVRVSDRRVTVVLPLPATADELWDGFRSKLRAQVRRPMKEGMEARFGADQTGPFYGVLARNMRDLGTPVLPRRFFDAIVRGLPAEATIGVVYHEGRPAAGGFGFLWRGELEMTWASAVRSLNRLAPNMLLYWEFMRHAIGRGASTFNFGRCPPGGGTHRFKLQWGGVDEPLPWLQWSASGAGGTPSPSSGRLALATRIWRRLPVRVATALGPRIARTIP
ncbi:MAG: GNAT family N-acetyltransferase [Gemmatimonadota bacterium]